MLSEIQMTTVASFRGTTSLVTDKKVNLVYGLNGTGKSTLSDFLYKPSDTRFTQCKMLPTVTDTILVYNQSFIHDHFYESDRLNGIFSLSKENKAAEQKIAEAQRQIVGLQDALSAKLQEIKAAQDALDKKRNDAADAIWEIKTNYCGGDRVLEFCLDGLRGQKDRLLSHLLNLPKPTAEPQVAIPQLKKDAEALSDASAKPLEELPELAFAQRAVECNPILSKAIVGNTDSSIAGLIKTLANSGWVKEGLAFLPPKIPDQGSQCPFCQQRTITASLALTIRDYFDGAYTADVSTLGSLERAYRTAVDSIGSCSEYTGHVLAAEYRIEFEKLHADCLRLLDANLRKLGSKLKTPSTQITLEDSRATFIAFNKVVSQVNAQIKAHNTKIADREKSLAAIKGSFWELMRWQYDQTVSRYLADKKTAEAHIASLGGEKSNLEKKIAEKKDSLSSAQKETINIDQAVESINGRLLDLGIEDFSIKKHSDTLYRLVRRDDPNDVFHTLSEGERMIISFLYFCELSLGRLSAEDTSISRIVVIDDPISSMSHVYIFNVGQLIRRLFFQSDRFVQVFVLTHSLYFFYELTDTNHQRRKDSQKLFRVVKNASGSHIQEMKYEEIQNDYQAYWAVINDPDQPAALLANCMRNVVEYFFNFVKRRDLNNVFQMPELQDTKYQAFCRYVNRESHSLGQNILDLKEFDYDVFREGLRLVFEKTGYADHYNEMSKT